MKNATLLLSLGILFCAFKANSQSKFYLSIESNFINDLYQIRDEGNAAGPPNTQVLDMPGATLIAGYEVNSIFSFEAGVAIRPVRSGFSLDFPDIGMRIEGGDTYHHIPLRTRARVPLFADWLFGTASLGTHLSVTDPTLVGLTFNSAEGKGAMPRNGDDIFAYRAEYTSYNNYYFTATAETGLDFKISPKINVYSTLTYNRGFTDLKRSDIQYQYRNEPVQEATVLHQGSYISVNIGLRFHFNDRV